MFLTIHGGSPLHESTMRNVSNKPNTLRIACAQATVHCLPETILAIRDGTLPKADPLIVARVAGIQAAKQTSLIIPYCHQVPLDYVGVDLQMKEVAIHIFTEVMAVWKTGVEMEALTAASAAALTLYDMLKPIDETIEIGGLSIVSKKGGKSDFTGVDVGSIRAAVLVVSDRGARGEREDVSGKLIKERLESLGAAVVDYKVIPDEKEIIAQEIQRLADEATVDVIITTGGSGIGPRDVTPEATRPLLQRELPGVAEFLRDFGQERTRYAMLSRGTAGIRGKTVVVNLPGSPGGVRDGLDVLLPWLFHAMEMREGKGHG
jgi:cyclic pyranopterin phosphate synthase